MTTVRRRKREMVERQIAAHLQQYKASGAELIMGSGRFIAPKTVEVILNEGGTRVLTGDKVFLDIGTHAAIPNVPGLEAAKPGSRRGSGARLFATTPDRDRWGLFGSRTGTGLSSLRQRCDYHRVRLPSSWVGKISTFPGRCGAFSATKVSEFFWRPNCSRYVGDLETMSHLSFAHPPVSKILTVVTSWSRLDALRTPAESNLKMPALN